MDTLGKMIFFLKNGGKIGKNWEKLKKWRITGKTGKNGQKRGRWGKQGKQRKMGENK